MNMNKGIAAILVVLVIVAVGAVLAAVAVGVFTSPEKKAPVGFPLPSVEGAVPPAD